MGTKIYSTPRWYAERHGADEADRFAVFCGALLLGVGQTVEDALEDARHQAETVGMDIEGIQLDVAAIED